MLGRTLAKHAIPYVIYERLPSFKEYNYGITLSSRSLDTLSEVTGIKRAELISRVAVDNAIGGRGRVETRWPHKIIYNQEKDTIGSDDDLFFDCLRANRGNVESLLASGLNIQYGSVIHSIDTSSDTPIIEFSSKKSSDYAGALSAQHDIVIAADGVHSAIRQSLLPAYKSRVAPIVAIYGKRRIPKEVLLDSNEWPKTRPAYMDFTIAGNNTDINGDIKDAVTRISVANSKDDSDTVDIEWVYSRPPARDDPLYKPHRSTEDSNIIHNRFFDEVRLLGPLKDAYPALWSRVFDVKGMKSDRMLSWLMRTVPVPPEGILRYLALKGVLFIGDSIHAEPIIGGQGYNNAIRDATVLAEKISRTGPSSNLGDFYIELRKTWRNGVLSSERHLASIHNKRPFFVKEQRWFREKHNL